MDKVAAYITAYEDLSAVERCITSITKQSYPVEAIYLVDNSSKQLISPILKSSNIIVKHHPENIGISGGLELSIQWAIEKKYDFLWTFDQDSQPSPNCLEKLIDYYGKLTILGKNIGIIAPLPIDGTTGQALHGIVFDKYKFIDTPGCEDDKNYYECDIVITSGSLVSISAAKQVPLPNKELFIDAVDWDYCMKFKQHEYDIFVVKQAILNHRFGNSRRIKTILRKRDVTVYNYSPLRYYYMCRNHTYIETHLAIKNNQLFHCLIQRIRFFIITLGKFVLYERQLFWIKIWACLKGSYDGLTGRLGKIW